MLNKNYTLDLDDYILLLTDEEMKGKTYKKLGKISAIFEGLHLGE